VKQQAVNEAMSSSDHSHWAVFKKTGAGNKRGQLNGPR
jgi:hypothetical protein